MPLDYSAFGKTKKEDEEKKKNTSTSSKLDMSAFGGKKPEPVKKSAPVKIETPSFTLMDVLKSDPRDKLKEWGGKAIEGVKKAIDWRVDMAKKEFGFAKDIVQSGARTSGSVGLTVYDSLRNLKNNEQIGLGRELDPEDKTLPEWQKKVQKTIFGDKPVKDIATTIADFERGTGEFGRSLQESDSEKVKEVGGFIEKYKSPIAIGSIGLGQVLDLTGFGGAEKNLVKALAKETDVALVTKILRQIGVADDLILPTAERMVKETDEKVIQKALTNIADLQKTTKVTPKAPKTLDEIAQGAEVPTLSLGDDLIQKTADDAVMALDGAKPVTLNEISKGAEIPNVSQTAIQKRINQSITPVPNKVTSMEKTLLKGSLKTQQKVARTAYQRGKQIGSFKTKAVLTRRTKELISKIRAAGKDKELLKKAALQFAESSLPVAERGAFVNRIANSTIPSKLNKTLRDINERVTILDAEKELMKARGSRMSRISFIKKVAGVNQTAVNEAKALAGIDKGFKKATPAQLDAVIQDLKQRLQFKSSKGFEPEFGTVKPKEKVNFDEDFYAKNILPSSTTRMTKTKETIKKWVKNVTGGLDVGLGTISTRLANINPKLRTVMRKFEFDSIQSQKKYVDQATGFLKKTRKLSPADRALFDLASKNGDMATMDRLAAQYNFTEELKQIRKLLDELAAESKKVGVEEGYLPGYFPRQVKDTEGLLNFLEKGDDWSVIDKAVKAKFHAKYGRDPNAEETVNLINTMMRGYTAGNVSLAKLGSSKERQFDFISGDLNKFYETFDKSLLNYIVKRNESIQARKFFGKELKNEVKDGAETGAIDLNNSIGSYIFKLRAQGDSIKPSEEKIIKNILTARFNQSRPGETITELKNAGYLTTMGSVMSAITQIGDMGMSLFKAPVETIPAFLRSVVGRSKIKKADIGLDEIAEEFSNTSTLGRAVNSTFKAVGLTAMDRIGKETLVNATIDRAQKLVKQGDKEFLKKLKGIFDDETTYNKVVQNLEEGVVDENTLFMAFNNLSDVQPISLSEVPELYLKAGNGRIFYMLKTYTIKQMDVYRNEVYNQFKQNPARAMRNLVGLATSLTLMGATADEIKNFITGEEVDFQDNVIANIYKQFGTSKYQTYQMEKDGVLKTLVGQIVPPTQVFDNVIKDIKGFTAGDRENITDYKSLTSIPIVGKTGKDLIDRFGGEEKDPLDLDLDLDLGLDEEVSADIGDIDLDLDLDL